MRLIVISSKRIACIDIVLYYIRLKINNDITNIILDKIQRKRLVREENVRIEPRK